LQYADAVVVGEADELWPQVLKDFEQGKLQQIYESASHPDDWDAYNMFTLTYEPAQLTEDELYLQLFGAYKELSSFYPSLKRGLKTLRKTRSGFSTGISFFWNHGIYKTLKAVPELKKWTSQV